MYYGSLLSNTPSHHLANLDALASGPFDSVEIQIELFHAESNGIGQVYNPRGVPPAQYLLEHPARSFRTLLAYACISWTPPLARLGQSTAPRGSNPYWLRRDLAETVERKGWAVTQGDKLWLNLTRTDVQDYLIHLLISAEVPAIRFDDATLHQHSYRYPSKPNVRDSDQMAGMFAIYDALREAGITVIANGAWEPTAPGLSDYPALPHVDGVMIEVPTGFKTWDTFKWYGLSDDELKRTAEHWRSREKTVIIAAPYTTQGYRASRFPNFLAHVAHYDALAHQCDALLWTGNDDPPNSAYSAVYIPPAEPAEPKPTPAPDPAPDLSQQLADLQREVAKIQAWQRLLTEWIYRIPAP